MKQQSNKKTFIALILLSAISYTGVANAHIYSGFMPGKTTQVLTLTCPAGTAQVTAQVSDGFANNGIMSVTIFKGANAQVASDLTQGGTGYGPLTTLVAGSGVYYLVASQTAAVSGPYKIQYHCEDANGTETTGLAAPLTQP